MKKVLVGILLFVVLMFTFSFAFAGGGGLATTTTPTTATTSSGGGGGGGGGGGPVVQPEPQELSKYEIYLLEQKAKKQITRMSFYLYAKTNDQEWRPADYEFYVNVVDGSYEAEWDLKAGRYRAMTYAYKNWDSLMRSESNIEVTGGGVTKFNPLLQLNEDLRFRLSVAGVPGNYEPGVCYSATVKYSDGTQYSGGCGTLDGKGNISLDQYLPTQKINPEVYITDANGDIHGFKANFNLLEAIDGTEVVIPYIPLSDTGILHVKVGYEMENKGLLVDKNPNFLDGDQYNPTGIVGQLGIKIADYLITNVTKNKGFTNVVLVHIGTQGDYFTNLWVRLKGQMYEDIRATVLYHNSTIAFYGSDSWIEAGETQELEIFADAKFQASGQGNVIDPIRVYVGMIDFSTMISFKDENVEGQAIYLADGGRMVISSNDIPSATFFKGSTSNNVLSLDITAYDEDICITETELKRFGLSNEWDIALVSLVSGTVPWSVSTVLVSDIAKFGSPYRLCVTQDSTMRLYASTDVSTQAEAGHQFGLSMTKLVFVGASSGKVTEYNPAGSINSNVFTIR